MIFIWVWVFFFFDGCNFNTFYNNYFVKNIMSLAYTTYKEIDKGFLSVWGPTNLESLVFYFSKLVVRFQTGLLYHYICWIMVGCVVLLFINNLWYFIIIFLSLVFFSFFYILFFFIIRFLFKKIRLSL